MRALGIGLSAILLYATVVLGQSFESSNLPIVIIDTHGQTILDDPKISADMGIIDNGPGVRNTVNDSPNSFNGKIGIEIRGSSSQMFPKKQYGIEIQDETGEGIDASILGMPEKDDWVLYAAYDDKTLLRDALAYRLSSEQGRYASRSRYCEVVLNGEYMGVYVFLEKVKRDKNRVNIPKLDPTSTSGDKLTGGYLIKIDKIEGSGGNGWYSSFSPIGSHSGQSIYFQYDYPKPEDIVPEQKDYIQDVVRQFETALAGENFKDPATGYAKYIDVNSFVDYFLLNEITKNPDGYRLSTYFSKQKDSDGGKIFMGPVWDYNEGFGNVDYCTQGNPEGFATRFNYICPDDYWQIPFWWDRLFQDEAFFNATASRWSQLRAGPYQDEKILAYVDSMVSVLSQEAIQRNFAKWPILGQYVWPNYYIGATYSDEIGWMKDWISKRVAWLDANLKTVTTGTTEAGGFAVQAYPNPFRNSLELAYTIDRAGSVKFEILDLMGRAVVTDQRVHAREGTYNLTFDTDRISPGLYAFRLSFGDRIVIQKMIKQQ
jgi:hypothetical protein